MQEKKHGQVDPMGVLGNKSKLPQFREAGLSKVALDKDSILYRWHLLIVIDRFLISKSH